MNLVSCLGLAGVLFCIGTYGLLTRRNLIAVLMSLELMVNAALINAVAFAAFGGGDAQAGSVLALFAVAVTAGEMAVALAIVIALSPRVRKLDVSELKSLHG